MKKIFLLLLLFFSTKSIAFSADYFMPIILEKVNKWEENFKKSDKKFMVAKLLELSIRVQFLDDKDVTKEFTELVNENNASKWEEFVEIDVTRLMFKAFLLKNYSAKHAYTLKLRFYDTAYKQLSDIEKKKLISPKKLNQQFIEKYKNKKLTCGAPGGAPAPINDDHKE